MILDDDHDPVDPALIVIPPYYDDPEEEPSGDAPKLSALVGLREVVEAMGRPPTKTHIQSLRRQIQAKEQLTQNKIMIQARAHGKFLTSLGALRRFMPELFVDNEISEMAKILGALREEIEILRNKVEKLERRQRASNGVKAPL